MSRGHRALQLLGELLVELDKQPGPMQAVMRLRSEWKYVERARALCIEAAAARQQRSPVPLDRDYCATCDAVHPPSAQPQSHGERRTG